MRPHMNLFAREICALVYACVQSVWVSDHGIRCNQPNANSSVRVRHYMYMGVLLRGCECAAINVRVQMDARASVNP